MKEKKTSEENNKEIKLKHKFFSAQYQLRKYLCNKYWKYHNKPIVLKHSVYKGQKDRIGFYAGYDIPTFINDARIHKVDFESGIYVLCEDEFEIYKKPIKDKDGKTVHYVDVKCPNCSHITLVDMQYLIYKYNCKNCRNTITVRDRLKK